MMKINQTNKLKQTFLTQKDIIYEAHNPTNPACILVDGSCKLYNNLNRDDKIWIKYNSGFIKGEITDLESDNGSWKYKVKTHKKCEWKKLSDFKTFHINCFKSIFPKKLILDLY
jgi:hypothetical protein